MLYHGCPSAQYQRALHTDIGSIMTDKATKQRSTHTHSYYAASAKGLCDFDQLQGHQDADVCVIGAGYTGLSTALHLAQRGFSVALLEAERVGWGASGRNGGQVGSGQHIDQPELEAKVGQQRARALWDISIEAVQTVRDLVSQHDIDCDLKQGILEVTHRASDSDDYQSAAEHLQNHYGYQHISFINRAEIRQLVGSNNYQCGSLDSFSCHLHPLNYALGLARAATQAGVKIFENSRVSHYSKGQSSLVTTANGSVKAQFVILACNGYLEKLEPQMAGKIMPINNFMLATEPLDEALCRELIRDDSAIADALFVVDYWRISGDNRLLFGGGENYTRRFPNDIKSFVRKYMLRVYPQLQNTRIDYGWGGTLAITVNRMPHFGRLGDNVFFAHGYSGHGVAMATMAGKLIAEAVAGTAERFDVMVNYPTHSFPGGILLRWPGLVAGMLFYSLRDKL